MRSFVLWAFFGLLALGVAACSGSTTAPVPVPAATTAANVILLPTAPPSGGSVTLSLPGPLGIVPALAMGTGFATGTQLAVSTSTYGQTASLERSAMSTFATCPVVVALVAYFNQAVPISAIQSFALAYGSALPFVGPGTFTLQVFDGNVVQPSGVPAGYPAPNGCPPAPNSLLVLATSSAVGVNGSVTFTNFQANPGISPSITARYGITATNPGTIPSNELFGFFVTYQAAAASPKPT